MQAPPRHRTWIVAVAYAAIAAASLWLRSAIPVFAIGPATHDDFLFVRLAYFLGSGQWLGPFDSLTLAKGMAYPAFILAAFLAGLPLKLAEQILYLAASGLAAWIATRMSGRRLVGLILFAVLAFNPLLWHDQLARVIREGIYGSLSLALVMLTAGALLGYRWGSRIFPYRLLLFVAAGLVGGAFWLTREEGIWIAPALAVLLGAMAIDVLGRWRRGERHVAFRLTVVTGAGLVAGVLAFAALVGSVIALNRAHYGITGANEFHSRAFQAAYGAVSRIQHDSWDRYVVFPKEARERAYAVSGAASELRPYFDGPSAKGWLSLSCSMLGRNPCSEILGGWFVWAFRDAVAAAGHYKSGRDAAAFYERLAAEINTACDQGRIPCLAARSTLAPPFRWQYVGDALAAVPRLGRILLQVGNGDIAALPSVGSDYFVGLMRDLVGPVARPETPIVAIRGTIETNDVVPILTVRNRGPEAVRSETVVKPLENAPGVAPGLKSFEFEITTDCLRPTCDFVARSRVDEIVQPVASILPGTWPMADAKLSIHGKFERGDGTGRPFASQMLRRAKLAIARVIARAYAVAMPVLTLLAVAGLVTALVLWRSRVLPAGILAVAFACAAAVATRMALLAYLDVTSIPAINPLYLSPATPFLLCFVVLGLCCGVMALGHWVASRRQPA